MGSVCHVPVQLSTCLVRFHFGAHHEPHMLFLETTDGRELGHCGKTDKVECRGFSSAAPAQSLRENVLCIDSCGDVQAFMRARCVFIGDLVDEARVL